MTPAVPLPDRARVVVVGGGVIGCSVAYHLAVEGEADVLLLERDRLTSGTTWHAAGLIVTFGSMSQTSTRLRRETRDLYASLEAETGQSTGLAQVGFLEVAADADRLTEFRRVAAFNRHCGVDVHEISARELGELFPLARTDDVLAAFHVPDDGRANPVDVTMALARGARQRGVRIVEGTAVTSVDVASAGTDRARVRGVHTTAGDVECDVVVSCAGMWARQLGEANGVTLPLQAAEHSYLITEAIDGVHAGLPVLEDPSTYGYIREETGGLLVGLFEGRAAPWSVSAVPQDFSFGTIPPDWDRIAPFAGAAMSRVPATLDAGIRTTFCGPESFTPDGAPLFGEVPEVAGYFVAAGLNSIGILTAGGLGRALAHWVVAGEPDVDVTAMDVARLHPFQAAPSYRRARTAETLAQVYACHYPDRTPVSGRGRRRSPLHGRLVAAGAVFRDVSGWEAANHYDPQGVCSDLADARLTFDRPDWFGAWAGEHRAVRSAAGLFDMSFMATFEVTGPGAAAVLDRLSTADVTGSGPGRVGYTQWLTPSGRIAADVTVTCLDGGRFWVTASDTAHRRVETILRRAAASTPPGTRVEVRDVTGTRALLSLQGPRSRDVLERATTADLAEARFAFRDVREIAIGPVPVVAQRLTYVGELGVELFVSAEHAGEVHDRIVAAGTGLGLRHAGLKALGSLRLERAYRDFGHDVDNTDTLDEVGLGFTARPTGADGAPRDFVGRTALLARRAAGAPSSRLVQVRLRDPEPLLHHGEVLRRDGVEVGHLRSASYGHTLGGAVGLAMVTRPDGAPLTQDWLDGGAWDVETPRGRHEALVSLRPPTNPR